MKSSRSSGEGLSRRTLLLTGSRLLALGSLSSSFAFLAGCGGGGGPTLAPTSQTVASQWVTTLLQAISAVSFGPPMSARAIGIVTTAMFDAWACYDAVAHGTMYGQTLRRPVQENVGLNKEKAISYAAYQALVNLFPSDTNRFSAKMRALGYDPTDSSTDVTTPQGIGNVVSFAITSSRHSDGSNQLNNYADTTGYMPVNTADVVTDPSQWQQLRYANGQSPSYIGPHWGNVTPFAMTSSSEFEPGPPPAYGGSTFLSQAQELLDIMANLNDTTKATAEYWADGPGSIQPCGHWQFFGQFVSEKYNYNLDQDVKLFFLLGNAVFDAGIAAWQCKRAYNSSRPITFIRALYAGRNVPSYGAPGGGIWTTDGSRWLPYQSITFTNPAFPGYISGHSTFSAAAAEVMSRFTGSDNFGYSVTIPAYSSTLEALTPAHPVTLTWSTLTEAADTAGISRLYGGIHTRADNEQGQTTGRLVGKAVYDVCMAYITGSAP